MKYVPTFEHFKLLYEDIYISFVPLNVGVYLPKSMILILSSLGLSTSYLYSY